MNNVHNIICQCSTDYYEISSRFSTNSKPLLNFLEERFPHCYIDDVCSRLISSSSPSFVAGIQRVDLDIPTILETVAKKRKCRKKKRICYVILNHYLY